MSPLPPAPQGRGSPHEVHLDRPAGPPDLPPRRTGLARIWHALRYSLQGLRAAWGEPAFREEALLSLVMLPLSFWLGRSWVEVALLAGSVLLVLIVELLNTAVEAAIDRIGPEHHALSGQAKDMGSAAVLLALLLAGAIWVAALWQRFAVT